MRIPTILPSAVLAFALPAVSSARQAPAAAPAPPLIREHATVKLTDHVWAIPDFNVGLVPNVGIIVGSKATLVVDTGLGPRNGETIESVAPSESPVLFTKLTGASTMSPLVTSSGSFGSM